MPDQMKPLMPPTWVPTPLPPEDWPSIDHIQTEDGAPVDGVFSEKQMRLLTAPLYSSWKTDKPFVAFANVGIFYGVDIPPVVPDVMLSLNIQLPENVFPKLHRSYFVWKYGKPPEIVIEIVSNKEGKEDTRKVDIYGDVRVTNYVIYDPECLLDDRSVRIYKLSDGGLIEDKSGSLMFPAIGLGLTVWNGRFEQVDSDWLRWVDLNGRLIPTAEETAIEESAKAKAEAARAEAEAAKAKAEAARADQATKKANEYSRELERLQLMLREKGFDPQA
jgi:Uma2 family endonuclease